MTELMHARRKNKMKKAVAIALALVGVIWASTKIMNNLESVRRRRKTYDVIYNGSERVW